MESGLQITIWNILFRVTLSLHTVSYTCFLVLNLLQILLKWSLRGQCHLNYPNWDILYTNWCHIFPNRTLYTDCNIFPNGTCCTLIGAIFSPIGHTLPWLVQYSPKWDMLYTGWCHILPNEDTNSPSHLPLWSIQSLSSDTPICIYLERHTVSP